MPLVMLGKTPFYYECRGKGTPLVLIAGYSSDHTFWRYMVNELARYFTVLTFDNRGVGQSIDTATSLTIELMAQDTMHLIKVLELQRPVILGQSMGGTIAQTIAHRYPNDIEKLIVLNSSAKLNPRTIIVLNALLAMFKEQTPFDTLIDASMPWFYSPQYLADSKNIAAYKEFCLKGLFSPTPALLARQLAAIQQFDARSWISQITIPTLAIASEDDIVCLPAESQYLADKIKGAKFTLIKGGHSSPVESPGLVLEKILHFTGMAN